MDKKISRRQFLGMSASAGAFTYIAGTLAPTATSFFGVAGIAEARTRKVTPFNFAILTDAHLYDIKQHRFDRILERAVDDVNKMSPAPDFVLYGGDLAQLAKPGEFDKGKQILSKLKMPYRIIPGEHDWYLDLGKGWKQRFGDDFWSFDHKGVHFIGMNSILVDDYWSARNLTPDERMSWCAELESHRCGLWGVGQQQLEWLKKDVARLSPDTPVIIMTHSPLWNYYPRWNFQTRDAPEIRQILSKFDKVMAIHGHVHQVVYNSIGNMTSAGLLSTSWPWPYPNVELPYPSLRMNRVDPADIFDGLGSHRVSVQGEPSLAGMLNYHTWSDLLPQNVRAGLTL
jgi:3',5'-cyclic-AMP phosphodiesterase